MARPPAPGFACAECGWTGAKWFGRCPECQAWGTVVENGAPTAKVTAMLMMLTATARLVRPPWSRKRPVNLQSG